MKLNKAILKPLVNLINKKEVRFFLIGMHVDFDRKEIHVTNGHVLVIMREVEGLEGKGEAIIPLESLQSAYKVAGKYDNISISFANDETEMGTIKVGSTEIPFKSIVAQYPNVSKIVLQKDINSKGFMYYVQAKYLTIAEELIKAVGDESKWAWTAPATINIPIFCDYGTTEDEKFSLIDIAIMAKRVDFRNKLYTLADIKKESDTKEEVA